MSRPKEFVPKEALQDAMLVFWTKGYCNTSVDDLVRSTGVSRHGIYSTFGNKHELYIAALDAYIDTVVEPRIARMHSAPSGVAEIETFFKSFIAMNKNGGDGPRGCFVCNAATEMGMADVSTTERTDRYLALFRGAFTTALNHAQTRGDIAPDVDTKIVASGLCASLLGLFVIARAQNNHNQVVRTVKATLSMLRASVYPRQS